MCPHNSRSAPETNRSKNCGPERLGLVPMLSQIDVKFDALTGHCPESKKKEQPLRRSLLVNTGRDDWIRTSDPLLPDPLGVLVYFACTWF